jgi:pyridoxamine 5'-phosphate oxidase
MDKNEIIDFIRKNPLFFLATCEGDQARVRGIMMYKMDETGNIVFTTGKNKPMYKQLTENPKVELCFYADNTQVRITGELVEKDELSLKQEIIESRPFMKPWVDAAGYDVIGVFSLERCVATCWKMESALARKRFVNLFD